MVKKLGLLVAVMFFLFATSVWASTNVALGAAVTTNGSGFLSGTQTIVCTGTPQAPSSVTDGVFHTEQDCWMNGVAWQGLDNSLDIDLGGTFSISSAIVQADDNDTYELQYRGTDGLYHNWWDVPLDPSWGLVTRPNGDQTTQQPLPTVTATGLRFFATGGDGDYAVSEIQVFATPTPEPSSIMLLVAGFSGKTLLRRRR